MPQVMTCSRSSTIFSTSQKSRRGGWRSAEAVLTRQMVDDLMRMFEPVAVSKGLLLTADIAPGSPEVIDTDRQRLEQILKNFFERDEVYRNGRSYASCRSFAGWPCRIQRHRYRNWYSIRTAANDIRGLSPGGWHHE